MLNVYVFDINQHTHTHEKYYPPIDRNMCPFAVGSIFFNFLSFRFTKMQLQFYSFIGYIWITVIKCSFIYMCVWLYMNTVEYFRTKKVPKEPIKKIKRGKLKSKWIQTWRWNHASVWCVFLNDPVSAESVDHIFSLFLSLSAHSQSLYLYSHGVCDEIIRWYVMLCYAVLNKKDHITVGVKKSVKLYQNLLRD